MNKVKELTDGKRIALIGNAESLFKSSYGPFIDSHDIVCRINKGYTNLVNKNIKCIGSKIDILFINLFKTSQKYIELYKLKKIISENVFILQMNDTENVNIENKIKNKTLVNLTKQLGSNPSTGIRCLYFLYSECNFSECNIFGFDFKKTPTISFNGLKNPSTINHDFEKERDFVLNNIIKKDKRFKIYEQ